ncbi:7-carboxy-7-deazaguanine synthase [Chromatium weissei]|nr:7-carboxy-7-deazaguanine synthase [Chromatium weissei]
MTYFIKEMFYSLQGEGAQAGRPAIFCRFAGCNLWSGREVDRANAVCRFCDTEFHGTDGAHGGHYADADTLAKQISALWPNTAERPFVVCTGGEPLLQLNAALIAALRQHKCEIAVETNGTLLAPADLDWLCVSPKAGAPLRQICGDELKLVYPQIAAPPEQFVNLAFRYFFLQPLADSNCAIHTAQAIEYCLAHPQWRLSLQTHKLLGIP